MTIILCIYPKIWSLMDRIFCYFWPFFALLPPPPSNNLKNQNFEKLKKNPGDIITLHMLSINQNHIMYGSWDIEHARQNFLSFWTIFCPSPWQPKRSKFWKTEKNAGDIIILHKCTKNQDHMLYCSWDMACDRCNCYFSFWAIFCPFTPLTAQKIKILKKWKKHLEISSFYNSVPKIMIICYTAPEIWCVTDVIIFHFGPLFALLSP